MLCDNCEDALRKALKGVRGFEAQVYQVHDSLTDFYHAISTGCYVCRQVWYCIVTAHERKVEGDMIEPESVADSVPDNFLAFHNRMSTIRAELGDSDHGQDMKIQLRIWEDFEDNRPFDLVVVAPTGNMRLRLWIEIHNETDMERFDLLAGPVGGACGTTTSALSSQWNKWLQECLESHANCRGEDLSRPFIPTRLVEIFTSDDMTIANSWRVSISDVEKTYSYVTLSHCWGTSEHVQLTKANLSSFSEGSLPVDLLPKTYQDAVDIAVKLGFGYIWIDSLCILQDDLDDWRYESSRMGKVYKNSFCNIASAFARDGEQGCYRRRDPAILRPTTIVYEDDSGTKNCYLMPARYLPTYVSESPLDHRAWVVQERCLPRRQLTFSKHEVFWECAQLTASEHFQNGIPNQHINDISELFAKKRLALNGDVDLPHMWERIVEHYSGCALTKETDRSIAIAGLAIEYGNKTNDSYIAGLWKSRFHEQLIWYVRTPNGTEPEEWRPTAVIRQPEQYTGPSWSWLSVWSEVVYRHIYCYPDDIRPRFLRLIDSKIASLDPMRMHSFTSCEVTVQAISLRLIIPEEPLSAFISYGGGVEVAIEEPGLESDSNTAIEDVLPQTDRGKEARLILSTGLTMHLNEDNVGGEDASLKLCAMVLQEVPMQNQRFVSRRLGVCAFQCKQLLNDITARLDLPPEDPLVNFDLGDSRIADLVEVITII